MNFASAPHLLVSPMNLMGIQSNFRAVLTKGHWVPVCQYPVSEEYRPEIGEQGMIAKLGRNGEIRKVVRRVFTRKS